MAIPNKVKDRLTSNLKKLIPILAQQKARDVSEADTVTLVKDLMSDAFGYDKYAELTSEFSIRGTYCDLAVKIEEKLVQLIEVKAVGITLDDRHVKQTVDYAANQGVEWVILTNGSIWRLYNVVFSKPIDKRLICEIDLSLIDVKKEDDLDKLYLFTKEGYKKGAHIELRDKQDATSRFMLAALLLNNSQVIATIRRELRKVVDVLADDTEIIRVLRDEVVKRDVLEGPEAENSLKRVTKVENRKLRAASREEESEKASVVTPAEPGTQPVEGVPPEVATSMKNETTSV